ncbi:hypothetical protein NDU88_001153 [Pleurodeles waltl]|uniref:SEA domain-containing protein n=1 Tax=Pleurodeles waltl TaxID=8319 RepID=A0AAV7W081_PLEWA|nr:hypothetical protein NDU88_001153 [Pleurodeles waltl]
MKLPAAWKILLAFLGVVILLFLAVAIPLIIVFVVFGPTVQSSENRYFSVSFKITNSYFLASFEDQSSNEYRTLADQIESLLNTTYKNSDLKKQYIKSQVIKLSPGSVVPQFVVSFANTTKGSGNTFKQSVQETLLQTIQTNSTGPFNIDPNSLQLQVWCEFVGKPSEFENESMDGSQGTSIEKGQGQAAVEVDIRGSEEHVGKWWEPSSMSGLPLPKEQCVRPGTSPARDREGSSATVEGSKRPKPGVRGSQEAETGYTHQEGHQQEALPNHALREA